MTTYYKIQDFFIDGFEYKLPDEVEQIIKALESSIVPTDDNKMQSTSNSSSSSTQQIRRKPKQVIGRVEDWNTVRSAKTIKPEVKVKEEGPEKNIKDIRIALNKFSNKNAAIQKDVLIELIRKVGPDDMNKVTDMIFEVVSSNGFYSELYVTLYKGLIAEFPFFVDKIGDVIAKYKDSFNNIVPVDPNVDYDAFCVYTKQNDLRKSMSLFIVNLIKHGVLESSDLLNIIAYLEELVFKFAEDASKSNTIEEITENMYIAVTESKALLKQSQLWKDDLLPNIHKISVLKKSDPAKYTGMSNRAIFKFMDLIDNL